MNLEQLILISVERMKAFLWFLMHLKGREEVAMKFLLKFEINVDEAQNQGA